MTPPIAFLTGLMVTVAFVPQWHLGAVSVRWAVLFSMMPVLAALATYGMRFWWLGFIPVAVAAISILWTPVTYDGVGALFPLLVVTMAALWASQLDERDARSLWKGVITGLLPSLIFGALQLARYHTWDTGNIGATGLFVSRVVFGELAALALVASIAFRMRWFWKAVPLLCMIEVLAWGGSREAALAVVVGIVALMVQRRYYTEAVCVLICTASAAALLMMLTDFRSASVALRINVWRDVVANLRPWGWGLGSFDQMYPLIASQSTLVSTPGHVHNDLLELVFELGWLAAPIFLFLLASLTRWNAPEWPVLCAFMVEANVSFPSHLPATALVVGVVLGRQLSGWLVARDLAYDDRLDVQPGVEPMDRATGAAGFGGGLGAVPVGSTGALVGGHVGWPFTDFGLGNQPISPDDRPRHTPLRPSVAIPHDGRVQGVSGAAGRVLYAPSRTNL